jgi:hypothetical protein
MRTKRPATVSSKATQVLHPQVGERAGERTLTGLAPDGTAGHSGIAFMRLRRSCCRSLHSTSGT